MMKKYGAGTMSGEQTYGAKTITETLADVRATYTAHEGMGRVSGMSVPDVASIEPPALPSVISIDDVTVPDLPVDAFPAPLGTMIDAVAKATETPVELAAMMGLATVAACS